jgi:hypothetical protein
VYTGKLLDVPLVSHARQRSIRQRQAEIPLQLRQGLEMNHEEPFIEMLRREVEQQYANRPTGCGGSFGEILCYELHTAGLTFTRLAAKWGIPVTVLGELIWDHCKRLEPKLTVNHFFPAGNR